MYNESMLFSALLLALLPGCVWLFFYLAEDPQKESKPLIALTLLSGAGFALLALAAQLLFYRLGFAVEPMRAGTVSWFLIWSLFLLSASEELVKFLAARAVIRKKMLLRLPLDAMIYMAVAALGFASVENLGSVFGAGGRILLWNAAGETLALRFMGATLLHTLTSLIVGYHWALSYRGFGRNWSLPLGLFYAIVLHAIFNYLIIVFGSLMYSLVFLVLVGLFAISDFEKLKYETT